MKLQSVFLLHMLLHALVQMPLSAARPQVAATSCKQLG
jgi:hypothetical protein